jgi:5-methylcytosine-specific restriction endonuclease McrA
MATDKRTRIAELLAAGLTGREIALLLGIATSTVSYHKARLHLPMNPKCARRHDWVAIQGFYDEGHSIRECQDVFGFSRKSWQNAVKRGALISRPVALPLSTLLVANQRRGRRNIKLRLLAAGLKNQKCEQCGISAWRGEPLSLALHHINGDGRDNRLENLVLLCPNCHSQTPNFGVKNATRGRFAPASATPSS